MNIDVCKTLINDTKLQENVITNNNIRLFSKQPWFPPRRDLLTTFQWHLAHWWLSKTPVQGNHSVNLLNYWMSKIKLPSSGKVLLNQRKKQWYQTACCGSVYQIGEDIQKLMNGYKNPFIIGFYIILNLCNTQSPMIVLSCLLTITLKHIWFQNCDYRCLSENYTLVW